MPRPHSNPILSDHDFEGDQHMHPQGMPLWYKDYFKLKIFEIQEMQTKSFPYLMKSSNFWDKRLPLIPLQSRSTPRRQNVNKTYPKSLLQGSFMALKETERPRIPVQTNITNFLTSCLFSCKPLSFHLFSLKYLSHSTP